MNECIALSKNSLHFQKQTTEKGISDIPLLSVYALFVFVLSSELSSGLFQTKKVSHQITAGF